MPNNASDVPSSAAGEPDGVGTRRATQVTGGAMGATLRSSSDKTGSADDEPNNASDGSATSRLAKATCRVVTSRATQTSGASVY